MFRMYAVVLGSWMVAFASAAPPQIARVTTPVLQTGATTTLVIEGTDLTPNPRLLLPITATQTVKEGATDKRVQIDVKLADNVPPGFHLLRLGNDRGISNAVGIEIDDLPLVPFAAEVPKLPVSMHGTLSGSATLTTSLMGKKGQRLTIEVEARRINSAIDSVVKVLDAKRIQLAWAQGNNILGGDTRLSLILPADGPYTIEMHDLQYRAGNPNRFRMKIGEFSTADAAFPLAGQRGTKASFQLIGTVPETTRVEADLTNAFPGSYLRLPRTPGVFGSMPRILISDVMEVAEVAMPKGTLQEIPVPAGINGRISTANEEDSYRLKVQPGMKLKLEVLAERAGSMLDAVLIIKNDMGAPLARSDDQPTTLDPVLDYTVPPGVTSIIAAVSDVQGRGGPGYIYRLSVTGPTQPDFTLSMSEDRLLIPRNGAAILRIKATRAGYDGPIKLSLPNLPEGVLVTGDDIPAGATETLLSLTAKDGAKLLQSVVPQVIGDSTDPKMPLRRLALVPEVPQTKTPPWMRQELALAVIEPPSLGIVWDALDARLPLGGKVAGKVKVTRGADVKGTVRLTLVTSQVVPKTKDNRMDDVNRAIRFEAVPTIAADQSAPFALLVPADLPPVAYDVAVKVEVLAADNRTVVMSATTPARRLVASK